MLASVSFQLFVDCLFGIKIKLILNALYGFNFSFRTFVKLEIASEFYTYVPASSCTRIYDFAIPSLCTRMTKYESCFSSSALFKLIYLFSFPCILEDFDHQNTRHNKYFLFVCSKRSYSIDILAYN